MTQGKADDDAWSATGPTVRAKTRIDRTNGTPAVKRRRGEVRPPTQLVPESSPQGRLAAVQVAKNPLLKAAQPLLRALADVPKSLDADDIPVLRRLLEREVITFGHICNEAALDHTQTVGASYALCTAIDEAINGTAWGGNTKLGGGGVGVWAGQQLAAEFHGDTLGGDKVFLLIGRITAAPAEHINLIEVLYMVLGLGFEGRFRNSKDGQSQLQHIRNHLFRLLEEAHGTPPEALSPHARDATAGRFRLRRGVPVWATALVLSLVLLGMYSWFHYQLDQQRRAVIERIRAIGDMKNPPLAPLQNDKI